MQSTHSRSQSIRRNALRASLAALLLLAATARAGQPVANFNWTPWLPNAGNQVNFLDQSTENPTTWLWNFGDPSAGVLNTSTAQNPSFIYNLAGTYIVTLTVSNNDGSSTFSRTLVAYPTSVLCNGSGGTLCLNNFRFSVTAEWTKPDGSTGSGHAFRLTNDSGYFWFFDAENIELVVKVLNGCGFPSPAYWVFAAGLTNVQVVLNIKDEQTGVLYTKTNPQGAAFVPIQDTGAFPTSCP